MHKINRFNIRVYGILEHSKGVLLSHEKIEDTAFTKFPGGGMKFGESPLECLKREFREELKLDVTIIRHIYTSDFFIQNHFLPNEQVITIYYLLKVESHKKWDGQLPESHIHPFGNKRNRINHSWCKKSKLSSELFSFEAEKRALNAYLSS
jgi:8-oxo-dGTP diphosphatase